MPLMAMLETDERGAYIVRVPSLPDCVGKGRTLDEAMYRITRAIDLTREKNRAA